jgi:hypothetical protein
MFNLAFLDIMSCGFGAVVLVFLITKHSMSVHADEVNANLLAEVDRIEEDVRDGELDMVRLRESLADAEARLAEAQARSQTLRTQNQERRVELQSIRELTSARESEIEQMAAAVEELEDQTADRGSFGEDTRGRASVAITGQGNRQYLTGLIVGGERILVLVDSSASMLDETIVNIIRRRNMSPDRQQTAEKWQRTLGTVDWLAAQFPVTSRFQIYSFSESWRAAIPDSAGTWLDVNSRGLPEALGEVRKLLPSGGTDLKSVFAAAGELSPLPDNIYLITDGLPTRDERAPRRGSVTGPERLRLYAEAARALPPGVPVNVILLPLEGDPMAASSYWKLAAYTGGSFMSPSRDWP